MAWKDPVAASRTRMKMERIARLEMAGYSDEEIAATVGITKQYVSMLRKTPGYIAVRVEVATGIMSEMDRLLIQDQTAMVEQLKQMVPNAVLVIRNTMLSPAAPMKLKLEAAKEVLDREGTFAKVSKSEIKKTETFKFDTNDLIQHDLLAALQQANQQKDNAEEFTNTEELSKSQKNQIQSGMTLIEMPSSNKTIQ